MEAKVTQEEVNLYLDALRAAGVVNMFGAAPYIEDTFDVDRRAAKDFLMEWMRTFSERAAKGKVVE